jgi:hypothetical protein
MVLFSTGTVELMLIEPLIGGGAWTLLGTPHIWTVHPDGNAASAKQSNNRASATVPPKAQGTA